MRKHGWFRPHVRGLTAISSTTLREGGGDIITSIFADGTDGFYFDFSTLSKLWTNTAGTTPVTAAGDNIARVDDSSPRGNNGTQSTTAAQPKWQTGGLARFDGLDDYHATTLVPAAAFTFMFKLKMPAKGAGTKIISGCRNASDTRSYIGMNNDGTLGGGLGSQASTTITGAVDHGGGTGVATMAWDGSRVELLWNAVREYEAAQAGSIQTAQAIFVGGWNDGGVASAFAGTDVFHALAVKKRLTQAQIAAITNLWGTT